jgi:hypothetical protein
MFDAAGKRINLFDVSVCGSTVGRTYINAPVFPAAGRESVELIDGLRGFLTAESFHHSIQSPAVDLENLGGSAHIPTASVDDVADVLTFNLLKGNQITGE